MSEDTSAPLPASVEVGAPDAPAPLTYEQAVSRKAELFSKPGWAERYLQGDQTARREFTELTAALALGAPDPGRTAREIGASGLKGFLKAHHIQEYLDQTPVTQDIHDEAVELRKSWMRDKERVAKYLDGDRGTRRELSLMSIVLNAPIAKQK